VPTVFLCVDDAYAVDAPVSTPAAIMRMPAQLPCCMHCDGDDEGRFRVNVDDNIYRAGPLSIKAVDGVLPILNARLVFYATDSVETLVPLTEHVYAPHVFVFDTLQDSDLMQVACTNKVYASVARYETTQLCFEVPTSLPPPYKAEVNGIDHNVIAHRDGLCFLVLSRSDCLNGCRKRGSKMTSVQSQYMFSMIILFHFSHSVLHRGNLARMNDHFISLQLYPPLSFVHLFRRGL
jgi:hypothetical protein